MYFYLFIFRREHMDQNDIQNDKQDVNEGVPYEHTPEKVTPVETVLPVDNKNKIEDVKLFTYSPKEIDNYFRTLQEKINDLKEKIEELRKSGKDELAEKLTEELKRIGDSYDNQESITNKMLQIRLEMAQYDNQIEYTTRLLTEAKERSEDVRWEEDKSRFAVNKIPPKTKGGELKGVDGDSYLLTRLQGLCIVRLFNSGFWIAIRNNSLWELNSFFQSIDIDEKTFGRILGGHYYHLYDFRIKEAFMSIIEDIVVDSSLKDFNKVGVLRKAIALPDINTLFAACCFMLYRNGIDIDVSCLEEECQQTTPVHVDLTKIRIINYSLLSPVHLNQLFNQEKESLSLNDVAQYQNTLNGISSNILCDKEPFIVSCSVANIEKYFKIANIVSNKIVSGLHSDNIQDKRFAQYLRSLLPWMYVAWIDKIVLDVDSDDPVIVKEPEKIVTLIEDLVRKNDPILTRIQRDFIDKVPVAHHCYPGVKCSACGKEPDDIKKDSYPADMQSLFFYQSSVTLMKIEEGLMSI